MISSGNENKWSTIQVSNLPNETSRYQLEQLFENIGPIKKCFVLKAREGKKTTIGYVTFSMQEDCQAALKLEDLSLEGSLIRMKLAPDRKIWNDDPKGKNIVDPNKNISKNKARLIIRNLSFKSDEESLRTYFSKHGPVVDVNILKKPDGRMVGCAFVEFKKVDDAGKAIKATNASQFMGRTMAVDWAVPKEVFKQQEIPEENDEGEKQESDMDSVKEDVEDQEDSEDDEEEQDDDQESDKTDEDEIDEVKDGEDHSEEGSLKPHNLQTGHDISEGKTVFIRNLSYESDEEDLRDMIQEYFGPVLFAKLVMDKVMGHPRGSAFVKFKRREDAQKCVEVGEGEDGIYLDNRRLNVVIAQEKGTVVKNQKEREKKEAKDNRNLYLAREGIIREGTAAAEGVSASDMTRRKFLEKNKKSMLKNLNMFVSPKRLCIRNLPIYIDDSKLRTLISKHISKDAKITEAKVMRKMNPGPDQHKSKEFGFVSFAKHEDALLALRNINNNPEIFTADRRPIVEFSIENRKALLARQKRLEKSREKNPNSKGSVDSKKLETKNQSKAENVEKTAFSGMLSDPKQKGLPTHSGPKIRTKKDNKISRKTLRKQEIDRKNPKKRKADEVKLRVVKETPEVPSKQSKKEKRKQKKLSKDAQKELESEKKFSSLVNQYRNNVKQNQTVVKKWFDN